MTTTDPLDESGNEQVDPETGTTSTTPEPVPGTPQTDKERSLSRRKWIAPALLGIAALVVAVCFTRLEPPENATAEQYLAQLVGLGAVFVAAAAVAKVCDRIWPKGGWDITEEVVKAVGLSYLAIVALVTYNFVGL